MNEISLEKAQEIATHEIEQRKNTPRLVGYEFSPVMLLSDEPLTWTFVSGSPQLHDEGCAPGAFFVTVDKRDGHIWTDDETEQYYTALAQQTPPAAQVAQSVNSLRPSA